MELEIILACGLLALVYGGWTVRSVLALPAGNARMQEIAAAIQEGARRLSQPPVHHHRHGGGGDHSAGLAGFLGWQVARGFLIGATPVSGAGRLCRHVCLGARQCPHRRSLALRHGGGPVGGVPLRRGDRHAGGGPRPSACRRLLRLPDLGRGAFDINDPAQGRIMVDSLVGLGFRRFADLDLRPPWRRHLHQGRRCRRRHGGQGRGRHSRRRPAQSRHHRRQCRRQCRRLRRHGGGPVRDFRGDHRRHHGAGVDLFLGRSESLADALSAGHRRR